MGCISTDTRSTTGDPLLVFSVVEPAVLGEPDKIGEDGESIYSRRPQVQLAGIFYKVATYEGQDGRIRDYPVIIAWSVALPEGDRKPREKPSGFSGNMLIMVLLGLLVAYLIVRRKTTRTGRKDEDFVYHPRRWEERRETAIESQQLLKSKDTEESEQDRKEEETSDGKSRDPSR